MSEHTRNTEGSPALLLDRLVSGDLDESGRREVLAWLEAEPLRWRRCGIAFLEAQTWAEAFEGWTATEPPAHAAAGRRSRTETARRRRVPALSAVIATCAVIAFGLGIFAGDVLRQKQRSTDRTDLAAPQTAGSESNGDQQPPAQPEPLLASLAVKPRGSGALASVHVPVVPSEDDASAERDRPRIPGYVRQQWERRGYRIDSERRYLLATLPDGEQVAVPVEQINLSPLEVRVY